MSTLVIYDCQYWVSAGLTVLSVSLAVLLICFRGLLFSCMFCLARLVFFTACKFCKFTLTWQFLFFSVLQLSVFFIEVKLPNFMCHMHICRLILKLTNMCFLCSFCVPCSLSFFPPQHNSCLSCFVLGQIADKKSFQILH